MSYSHDAVGLESALHRELCERRVNRVNHRRECFYATPAPLEKHAGEVLEYVTDPEPSSIVKVRLRSPPSDWGNTNTGETPHMPEPVLISIAAALAGKAVTSLYDFVKGRFAGRPEAARALEAATGAEPDSAEVRALGDELAKAEAADPGFADELRARWRDVSVRQKGEINNQISGTVTGNVVQARDIEGGISF